MIPEDFIGIIIVLTVFVIVMLIIILTGNFWKAKEQKKCSYCSGELSNCKITVTNEYGTKVYCDPYCLETGLSLISLSLKDIKESPVSKACRNLLRTNRIPHWRNNVLSGLFKAFGGGKAMRAVHTGTKGMGDISFVLTDGSGRTAYLETKRPVGGIQSDDQKAFEATCIKNGIPYFLVSSVRDLEEVLEVYEMLEVKL